MKVSNVTVWVREPALLRDWYVKHLGFRAEIETARFVTLGADGETTIAFHEGEPLVNPSAIQFHIEVSDLDALFMAMRASGVSFDGEPEVRPWGVRSVSCLDPAGHSVELVVASQ